MFYEKQSNNQVLRMQTMHTGVPIANEAEELRWAAPSYNHAIESQRNRRFVGIEFAVVHAQPPTFFIIQKRERVSPDEGGSEGSDRPSTFLNFTSIFRQVKPLASYFIMNNRIYQSPDVYTVLSNRLVRANLIQLL